MKIHKPSGLLVVKVISVLGVVFLIATSIFFYLNYKKTQSLLKDPTRAAKEETQLIVGKLGKLMELPDEEPTIATVLDREKLKDQPFFNLAQNGDKVIIFNKAMKAILYRPETNKVVDFAPINLANTTPSPVQPIKVSLYNGTKTAGLTKIMQGYFTDKKVNIEVVDNQNAGKNDYEKTLVVDISGNKSEAVKQLAEVIGGRVAELPEGETKPDSEVLVIIGSDFIALQITPTPTVSP